MFKKIFYYVFCPNWVIYKSISAEVSAYRMHQYWEIPGSRHTKILTINIMFSSIRKKYKIVVLNILKSEKHALGRVSEYTEAQQLVYQLNHLK